MGYISQMSVKSVRMCSSMTEESIYGDDGVVTYVNAKCYKICPSYKTEVGKFECGEIERKRGTVK